MGRNEAKALADEEIITVGELQALIANAPTCGQSLLNPALSKQMALAILRASLEHRNASETFKTWGYSPTRDREVRRSDHLIVSNILRECAPKGWRPAREATQ